LPYVPHKPAPITAILMSFEAPRTLVLTWRPDFELFFKNTPQIGSLYATPEKKTVEIKQKFINVPLLSAHKAKSLLPQS